MNLSFLLPLLLSFLPLVSTLGQQPIIAFTRTPNSIELASATSHVELRLDAADWPGVLRAANDLAVDFGRVTGVNGSVVVDGTGEELALNGSVILNMMGRSSWEMPAEGVRGGVVIVGTLGRSEVVDGLVREGNVDVSGIRGQWEAFTSRVVRDPVEGVEEALVVVGSDKRGTIYGLYDISEQIGVSPWHFWADVPPQRHDAIHALDEPKVQGSPSVKYRGIFINDEAPALTGYINAHFPRGRYGPGYNADFYATVFELLLRLRANFLWPAMWDSMFAVDDSRNQPLADAYGVVMSTSHTEPMMRATKEWTVFGHGAWQWSTNNASITPFFVAGAARAKPYESVVTVGMRGAGDTAMSAAVETDMLEDVVRTQREILADVYGNATAAPQVWCLYKEVQAYYEAGMRVPDDITLLWTDDNYGNIRRLPTVAERNRSGGAGVYYHFDYVGDPRDYKWINTVSPQKTWEQMHRAYERHARQIWVVNVGDLKPLEMPISHFLDLACDISLWDKISLPRWLELWAAREFGLAYAKDVAAVANEYSRLAARRKFESLNYTIYSIINYEEGDRVLAEWERLAGRAQAVYDRLPEETRDAFFEMVLHPVLAGRTVHEIHIGTTKNHLYARQGRNSANVVADRVRQYFTEDHNLTVRYHSLRGGKWAHMMDQTHLGYQYWQQPMRQSIPPLHYVQTLEDGLAGNLGVSITGSNASVPGDDVYHTLSSNTLTLPPITPYLPSTDRRYIDIYSTGTTPCTYTITTDPFVLLSSPASGTLTPDGAGDTRIYLTLDWTHLPPNASGTAYINITSSTPYGTQYSAPSVLLPYTRPILPPSFTHGHVESPEGIVAGEAAHYTRILPGTDTNNPNITYAILPFYGPTLSALVLQSPPDIEPPLNLTALPSVEYAFYTFTAGTAATNVTLWLAPGLLNAGPDRPLRYAVALDDRPVRTVGYVPEVVEEGGLPVGWYDAVSCGYWVSVTGWGALEPGAHVLRVWGLGSGVGWLRWEVDVGGDGDGGRYGYLGYPESVMVGGGEVG